VILKIDRDWPDYLQMTGKPGKGCFPGTGMDPLVVFVLPQVKGDVQFQKGATLKVRRTVKYNTSNSDAELL
jgi:hypothetical protein